MPDGSLLSSLHHYSSNFYSSHNLLHSPTSISPLHHLYPEEVVPLGSLSSSDLISSFTASRTEKWFSVGAEAKKAERDRENELKSGGYWTDIREMLKTWRINFEKNNGKKGGKRKYGPRKAKKTIEGGEGGESAIANGKEEGKRKREESRNANGDEDQAQGQEDRPSKKLKQPQPQDSDEDEDDDDVPLRKLKPILDDDDIPLRKLKQVTTGNNASVNATTEAIESKPRALPTLNERNHPYLSVLKHAHSKYNKLRKQAASEEMKAIKNEILRRQRIEKTRLEMRKEGERSEERQKDKERDDVRRKEKEREDRERDNMFKRCEDSALVALAIYLEELAKAHIQASFNTTDASSISQIPDYSNQFIKTLESSLDPSVLELSRLREQLEREEHEERDGLEEERKRKEKENESDSEAEAGKVKVKGKGKGKGKEKEKSKVKGEGKEVKGKAEPKKNLDKESKNGRAEQQKLKKERERIMEETVELVEHEEFQNPNSTSSRTRNAFSLGDEEIPSEILNRLQFKYLRAEQRKEREETKRQESRQAKESQARRERLEMKRKQRGGEIER